MKYSYHRSVQAEKAKEERSYSEGRAKALAAAYDDR